MDSLAAAVDCLNHQRVRITSLLLTLGFSAAATLGAQQLPFRAAKVTSCPSADSLIGKMKSDWDGRVYGFYSEAGDSTLLWSGSTRLPDEQEWWVSAGVRFAGRAMLDYPRPVLGVMLRGRRWHQALSAATPPQIALLLDDSILVAFAPPLVGQYVGPERGEHEIIPLSVSLTDLQFMGLVRAKRITVRVGTTLLELGGQDRHDLRGLFRVAACHRPVEFGGDPQ